jgi:hypothetical protein
MEKMSISFVFVTLILGLFLGTVMGSLLSQVFGMDFLNRSIFGQSITMAENFYVFKRLDITITPASLIGLILTIVFLYKKGKG